MLYDRLANDKEYSLLLHGLWHYQYTRYATDLTAEMQNWLYRKTQGIPDILVKLLYSAQKQAILDGRETLDYEIFESAFLKNLGMVSEYMSELSQAPLVKNAPTPAAEPPVTQRKTTAITGDDLRLLLKRAKRSGTSPVIAYTEYIKGEVTL